MITIEETENGHWKVMLNGMLYTSCDTIEDARAEAKKARRELRYGI